MNDYQQTHPLDVNLPAPTPNMKHSGMGIASFALSLIAGLLSFVAIAIAGVMEATTEGGMPEDSPVTIMVGFGILFCAAVGMVAVALGIASLFQADRKKIFGILGLVFSAATIVVIIALIVVGTMIG